MVVFLVWYWIGEHHKLWGVYGTEEKAEEVLTTVKSLGYNGRIVDETVL